MRRLRTSASKPSGQFVEPKIREHRGRTLKNTGDGFLSEFSTSCESARPPRSVSPRLHGRVFGSGKEGSAVCPTLWRSSLDQERLHDAGGSQRGLPPPGAVL